jgi:hypothetical protein
MVACSAVELALVAHRPSMFWDPDASCKPVAHESSIALDVVERSGDLRACHFNVGGTAPR